MLRLRGSPPAAVLLCGGRGTRAWPLTEDVPKPLLPVHDRPAIEHLVQIFADQGVREIVLATGYKGEAIERWLSSAELRPELHVQCLDTGLETNTGERVRRCSEVVGETFFVTYGDGLGNVDLGALLAAHQAGVTEGALATLTTVPLPSPYGTLEFTGDGTVLAFHEKPTLDDHWINAGFFVFERAAFQGWAGPDLERDVLPKLAKDGKLRAYRHPGFWKSMDTHKDVVEMTRLAKEGAPWSTLPASRS